VSSDSAIGDTRKIGHFAFPGCQVFGGKAGQMVVAAALSIDTALKQDSRGFG